MARAKEAKPLKTQKETGRGKTSSNTTSYTRGADYLTARIARDRPDILEGMKPNGNTMLPLNRPTTFNAVARSAVKTSRTTYETIGA
jgi:hypothetical protein